MIEDIIMTTLRQQAQEMFDSFPDEKLTALIQFMKEENLKQAEKQ